MGVATVACCGGNKARNAISFTVIEDLEKNKINLNVTETMYKKKKVSLC